MGLRWGGGGPLTPGRGEDISAPGNNCQLLSRSLVKTRQMMPLRSVAARVRARVRVRAFACCVGRSGESVSRFVTGEQWVSSANRRSMGPPLLLVQ
jgi:hypothetical protein